MGLIKGSISEHINREFVMITFACPQCQKPLRFRDNAAGTAATCPICEQTLRIPALAPGDAQEMSCPVSTHEKPRETIPDGVSLEAATAVRLSATPAVLDARPDAATWPTGFSAQDASSFLLPPERPDELGRLGDYRVLKVLGAGGMGVVFLAEDVKLKRFLAVKAMKPALAASGEARERFLREAQAAAAIDHEHVISIYQVGEVEGVPFLAMPLLKGESLEARLQREGSLPLREVLRIGRETAEGLEAAHASGLVHRDVKPSNIWLEAGRDRVKILDFGLARARHDPQLTQAGSVFGTPVYMAPEQADGKPVSRRGDLYSLGCVLYRMSSGELPFKGNSVLSVLKKVLLDVPRPLDELNPEAPVELSRLVADLMAKDPAARPASGRLVADALALLEKGDHLPVRGSRKAETAEPAAPAAGRGRTDPLPGFADDRRQDRGRGRGLSVLGMVSLAVGATVLGLGLVALGIVLARNAGGLPFGLGQKQLTVEAPEGWQSFSPPGGRFTVLLPGEPKKDVKASQTERGPIETCTFTIESGQHTYAAGWFDFPGIVPQGPQIKNALEGGQQGLLKNLGDVTILKDEEIALDGHPGKEVVIENKDKRYTLTVRLYLVRQRTYTLLASAPLGQADAADVKRFFASFRLVP
jgi:Protein kinase domain